MSCLYPIKAWYPSTAAPDARLVFDPRRSSSPDAMVWISCNQCIACRLYKAQTWAVRCMHEKRVHKSSCFLTLTYDDAHLPDRHSLVRDEIPKFNKRLRDYLGYPPISVFYCGEYGEKFGRPHYHQILFGYDPPDKVFYKRVRGHDYFTSDIISKCWGLGHAVLGNVDFDSAAYVARYTLKKQKKSDEILYTVDCPTTGVIHEIRWHDRPSSDIATREIYNRLPVFAGMSTNPAIGLRFLERYPDDLFSQMKTVFKGHEISLPRYYLKKLETLDPLKYRAFKAQQKLLSKPPDLVRLKDREEIILSRIKPLTRSLSQ